MRFLLIIVLYFLGTQATLGACAALPARLVSPSKATPAPPAASTSLFITNPDPQSESDDDRPPSLHRFKPLPDLPPPEPEEMPTAEPSTPGGPLYIDGKPQPSDIKGPTEMAAAIQAVTFVDPEDIMKLLKPNVKGISFRLLNKAKQGAALSHLAQVTVKLPKQSPYQASWQLEGQRPIGAYSAAWWPGAIEAALWSAWASTLRPVPAKWTLETLTGRKVGTYILPSTDLASVLHSSKRLPSIIATLEGATVLRPTHHYVLQSCELVDGQPTTIKLFDTSLGTGQMHSFSAIQNDILEIIQLRS